MTNSKPAPLFPVFLPLILTFGCLCLPSLPLAALSRGMIGFASAMANCGGFITSLVMTAGLALTRTASPYAKHVRWSAYALTLGLAVWIVLYHHFLTANALAGADAASQRTLAALGEAQMPWVCLAALLSLVPTTLGGALGVRWIEAKVRAARVDAEGAARTFE